MEPISSNHPSLLQVFGSLDISTKKALANIESPMVLGLAALLIAEDKANHPYLTSEHIVSALEAAGVSLERNQIGAAFSRAGNKISRNQMKGEMFYRIMTSGRQIVEDLLHPGSISVAYIEEGKPRTARKILAELLSDLTGDVSICDPYYGIHSLDTLELIPKSCNIRFLTSRTNENDSKISRAIVDFKRERPNTEIRVFPNTKILHDRYILTRGNLFILGHGLKDIGNRESFVVCISRDISQDLLDTVGTNFDDKWAVSTPK